MIDGKIGAFAVACAQGRDAEHVGDELNTLVRSRSRSWDRNRTGAALPYICRRGWWLADLVLDQAVRPGDADHVDRWIVAGVEEQRHAGIGLLPIQRAGFDLDFGILREFQTLYAVQADANPSARGGSSVERYVEFAVGQDARAIQAAVVVEVRFEASRPADCRYMRTAV